MSTTTQVLERADNITRGWLDAGSAHTADIEFLAGRLTQLPVRDVVWARISQRPGPGQQLATDLVEAAPDSTGALFLRAFAAWMNGDTATRDDALTACLIRDPDYSAARMLVTAIQLRMPPEKWQIDDADVATIKAEAAEAAS